MSPLALSLHFLQAQPDARLVALARDGHEPAFEALVHRYRKELLSYCRRLQPRSSSAEDALQQTLLQAWRALKAGAEVREVRPWLYRIAHNVSLNNRRVAVAVPQEIPDATGGHEVDQLVEQRLQARAALAGMASLPALQRAVFVSATLDGASHDEVATALGLSSGAVRGLIYRARATLRAAAAAITPSPVLHWAIKRAEARPSAPAIVEALASGGGGAGVAAALAKGGAVLTLAGAVAGAGGVILSHGSTHHRRSHARVTRSLGRPHAADRTAGIPAGSALAAIERRAADRRSAAIALRHAGAGPADTRGQDRRSGRDDHRGSGRDAAGGRDGGSGGGSGGSSDGSSGSAATASSTGSSGATSGGSSGGSDGGSSASSEGSTSTTSVSDGGTSGGGPGPSGSGQLTTAQTASDGGSGSNGGSVSSSDGSSGSGDTTTTTSTSH